MSRDINEQMMEMGSQRIWGRGTAMARNTHYKSVKETSLREWLSHLQPCFRPLKTGRPSVYRSFRRKSRGTWNGGVFCDITRFGDLVWWTCPTVLQNPGSVRMLQTWFFKLQLNKHIDESEAASMVCYLPWHWCLVSNTLMSQQHFRQNTLMFGICPFSFGMNIHLDSL